jgi:hypothetical protein
MSLLSLEQFRIIMGFNPWFFWGLASTTKTPLSSACNGLVYKYAWQSVDAAGRVDIQNAIDAAEERLIDYLEFAPAPHYVESTVEWPRYNQQQLGRLFPVDARGRWMSVQLPEGKVQKIGIETYTHIEDASVVLTDADSDGLKDTFTLITAAALGTTKTDEIAVYFKTTDQLDGAGPCERWRIQPVKVKIMAGVATITGPAWMLVKPLKYEGMGVAALDPDTAANFVTSLDVERHWTNPDGLTVDDSQAVLIWETLPQPYYLDYVPSSSDPAAIGQVVARAGIRNADIGEVIPAEAVYDAVSGTWYAESWCGPKRPPDRVKVRYLAGEPLVSGEMNWSWQKIIARLAAAELARSICGCAEANRELYTWQFDLSRAGGRDEEQYKVSDEDLSNPFGVRRGHVYAWKQVKNLALMRGILI